MKAETTIEKPEAIYLYGTCLMDLWAPNAGMAVIELIKACGVNVIYPPQQTCCGQPAFNSGFRSEAKKVAAEQIRLFPKNIPIVVPSGSCAAMMKHHYPELFEGDPMEEEARQFSARIYEFTWFLVHVLDIQLKDKGNPETVTWHSSCHTTRAMGVKDEPYQLLDQLENVSVQRLEKEYECCGFGGTFAVKHAEISGAMVEDKVMDIRRTGASTVLGSDCGCLMNISGRAEHEDLNTNVTHLAEYLLSRIKA